MLGILRSEVFSAWWNLFLSISVHLLLSLFRCLLRCHLIEAFSDHLTYFVVVVVFYHLI